MRILYHSAVVILMTIDYKNIYLYKISYFCMISSTPIYIVCRNSMKEKEGRNE